jgi:hypothetical protein
MDAIGGHQVKRDKSGSKTQKTPVFSHTWKIDPKINIHKNKYDLMQTQRWNLFVCNSGTTLWKSEKEGKEKRMIEHQ